MLIKHIEIVDYYRLALHRVFSAVHRVLHSVDPLTHLYRLIIASLAFIPSVSILFKQNMFEPVFINSIFRCFLISSLGNNIGISQDIVNLVLVGICILSLILTAAHLIFDKVSSICSKLLNLIFSITTLMMVPLCDEIINSWKSSSIATTFEQLTQNLAAALLTLHLIVCTIFLKFSIRVLRKKSRAWNYSNEPRLYTWALQIGQIIYVSINGVTITLCLLSLGLQYFRRHTIPGGPISKLDQIIALSTPNYIAATYLSICVCLVCGNNQIGLIVWVLLMTMVFAHTSISYYQQTQNSLYMPPCNCSPFMAYEFYFLFKEQYKLDDFGMGNLKRDYSSLYALHEMHCQTDICKLDNQEDNIDYSSEQLIEEWVSTIIENIKTDKLEYLILWETWCLQRGRKYNLDILKEKQMNFNQQFIIASLLEETKNNGGNIDSLQSSKAMLSKTFYDIIYATSVNYSTFYEQLSKSESKIEKIVSIGGNIRTQIASLKKVYVELVRTKQINFKMIEIYLAFFTHFLNEESLDKDSVDKLSKIQKHPFFDDISESYIPVFVVYPNTGIIQNCNAQAQKYLMSTRFQLKYKNICDLIIPSVSITDILATSHDNEQLFTLIRRGHKQLTCARLIINDSLLKSQDLIYIEFCKESFSSLKNVFLIDEAFTIMEIIKEEVTMRKPSKNELTKIVWKNVFEEYVLPLQYRILKTRFLRVPTDDKICTLQIRLCNTLVPKHYILIMQYIVSKEKFSHRRSTVYSPSRHQIIRHSIQSSRNNCDYNFIIDDQVHDMYIISVLPKAIARAKRLKYIQSQNQSRNSQFLGLQYNSKQLEYYGKDIKTYRLSNGDIYNVMLQDKQAYVEQFKLHVPESRIGVSKDQNYVEFYIFLLVVLLGLSMIGIILASIINFSNGLATTKTEYAQYQNMEMFTLDFTRIISTYRDLVGDVLIPPYPPNHAVDEINESYNRIQSYKNKPLFTDTVYSIKTIDSRSLNMTGTLNQLIDVMLAHIQQIIETQDLQLIENIHQVCILSLSNIINIERDSVGTSINQDIAKIILMKNIMVYVIATFTILMDVLMVIYCYKETGIIKLRLSDLLFMPDIQARAMQENAEKMKYVVEMARKKFDVDLQGIVTDRSRFKKRQNSKMPVLGQNVVYAIGAIIIITLGAHMSGLFYFSSLLDMRLGDFDVMMQQGDAITGIYSDYCSLSNNIDHTSAVNQSMLKTLRLRLEQFQSYRNSLLYSNSVRNIVEALYYANSCKTLQQWVNYPQAICALSTPKFTLENPFVNGLATYYHRMYYYLTINLTETFAATGIYSQQFARIYTNLTQIITQDGFNALANTSHLSIIFCCFVIILDIIYVVAFILFYIYFRKQLEQVKQIVIFFNIRVPASDPVQEEIRSKIRKLSILSSSQRKSGKRLTIDSTLEK